MTMKRLMRMLMSPTCAVCVVCVAGSIAGVSTVEAQTKLSVSGQKRTIACGSGETVQVTGQRNTLTVTGDCRKVDITGAKNTVSIEAVGSIEVTGTDNDIIWHRAIGGNAPRVSANGAGNTISRADASETRPRRQRRRRLPAIPHRLHPRQRALERLPRRLLARARARPTLGRLPPPHRPRALVVPCLRPHRLARS